VNKGEKVRSGLDQTDDIRETEKDLGSPLESRIKSRAGNLYMS
jgi:hypothetical protein